nr:MAG TPA: hypothetical protein [Caudoviricetes sp.]
MITIEVKDIIGIVLTIWANIIATIALVHSIRKDKRKTAPKHRSRRKR